MKEKIFTLADAMKKARVWKQLTKHMEDLVCGEPVYLRNRVYYLDRREHNCLGYRKMFILSRPALTYYNFDQDVRRDGFADFSTRKIYKFPKEWHK